MMARGGPPHGATQPPWVREPYRLWSLYDMLRPVGQEMLKVLHGLRRAELIIANSRGEALVEKYEPLGEHEHIDIDLDYWVGLAQLYCNRLGYAAVDDSAKRLKSILAHEDEWPKLLSTGELGFMVKAFRELIDSSFRSSQFYFVSPSKAAFFDEPELFGSAVKDKFGKASFHIQEAGNCLALDRSTAAVFHLMCVLEVALDSLASALGLPYSEKNWGTILGEISKAIENLPTEGPKWKEDKEFYGEAALEFRFIKDAWRNHVAHGRAKYTESEAASVFEHVKALMRHLAGRLGERP